MKKEKDHCKDCAEYGSEFCPECLEELDQLKTGNHNVTDNELKTEDVSKQTKC